MMSSPLMRYILTAVMRDRVVQIMMVLMILGTSASVFLGGAVIVEQKAYTIASVATVLRSLAVLGLVIFISFFVRRAFESREIDYLLATPLTRHKLLSSFSLAFIVVAAVFALMISLVILVLLQKFSEGWLIWSASVLVELSITSMVALFFAVVLKSATVSALCSFGFYSLARMLGAMIGIITSKFDGPPLMTQAVDFIVKIISAVTPRFDLLAQSAWLVYGDASGFAWWILPVQFVAFCTLFFVCAAYDLRRSQF